MNQVSIVWPRDWKEWPSILSMTALILKFNVAVFLAALVIGVILGIPMLVLMFFGIGFLAHH